MVTETATDVPGQDDENHDDDDDDSESDSPDSLGEFIRAENEADAFEARIQVFASVIRRPNVPFPYFDYDPTTSTQAISTATDSTSDTQSVHSETNETETDTEHVEQQRDDGHLNEQFDDYHSASDEAAEPEDYDVSPSDLSTEVPSANELPVQLTNSDDDTQSTSAFDLDLDHQTCDTAVGSVSPFKIDAETTESISLKRQRTEYQIM